MASKTTKLIVGTAFVVGTIVFVRYLVRQSKMLKDICVTHTSLEWRNSLQQLATQWQEIIAGDPIEFNVPLKLQLVNNSDIDVTVKEIDFDIYFESIHIGSIFEQEPKIIKANSRTDFDIYIDLDLQGDWINIGLEAIGGNNKFEVIGNIVLSASIYETLNYPYQLIVQGNQVLKEVSGECKLED
tara:strand:- start:454 stop:1008 length:555 start_codon:yes stop_codon:yes gene_type:complete